MALNATEIAELKILIGDLREQRHRKPRVFLFGYPDLLLTATSLEMAGIDLPWDSLPKRALEKSAAIWAQHGRPHLSNYPMVEAKGLFKYLGADVCVMDAVQWENEDLVLDLNKPLRLWTRWRVGQADLVIDPGSIEHCFNIAQAFDNVDRLLAKGGIVYHQSAAAFPNHGFWSISPTAFYDFYQSRGYELGYAKQFDRVLDNDGFVVATKKIDPFVADPHPAGPMIVSYSFRKPLHPIAERAAESYPTQRCYS